MAQWLTPKQIAACAVDLSGASVTSNTLSARLRRAVESGRIRPEQVQASERHGKAARYLWPDVAAACDMRPAGDVPDSGNWKAPEERVDAVTPADDRRVDDDEVAAALERERQSSDWVEAGRYVYDGERDVYIFSCPSSAAPVVRTGDWVRSLWRRYTGGATIDDVCRTFALDRTLFLEIKTALRLTKTRAPFTDEELASCTPDDLVASALRAKEREVMGRVEREHWHAIKAKAQKFDELELWRASVAEQIATARPAPPNRGPRVRIKDRPECVVYIVEADAHVDMCDVDGVGAHVHAEAARRVRALLVERVLRVCRPTRLYYSNGGDLSNADNPHDTTTNGTPQKMGLPHADVFDFLMDVQDEAIATWADACEALAVLEVFGNHDHERGRMCFAAGRRIWRDRAGVTWLPSHRGSGRCYSAVGDTSVVVAHGDKCPPARIKDVMVYEHPGFRRRVAITGHTHQDTVKGGVPGVSLITVPALSADSDWALGKGFVGDRAWSAVVMTPEGFVVDRPVAYVAEVAADLYPRSEVA